MGASLYLYTYVVSVLNPTDCELSCQPPVFYLSLSFFKAGSLYGDSTGLKLTETACLCLLSAGVKGVRHYASPPLRNRSPMLTHKLEGHLCVAMPSTWPAFDPLEVCTACSLTCPPGGEGLTLQTRVGF